MSGFRIRDARSADRDAIAALWRELMAAHRALDFRFSVAPDGEPRYARHAQEMMRSRDARVLVAVAEETGEVIGYLMGELQARAPLAMPGLYGFVSDVYVRETWRRHGVGRALFTEIRRWFLDRKASAIELYVAEANPAAVAFWRSMGMEPFLKLLHHEL